MKPIFLTFLTLAFAASLAGQKKPAKILSSPQPITEQSAPMITLIAGGDVMLGRSVNTKSNKERDYTWAFKNIAREFSSADISLVNLEAPFTPDCRPTDTGMVFCAPEAHIQGLKSAGIDMVNLANNHIRDQGQQGVDFTISTLRQNGLTPIGFDKGVSSINGIKFGFLGFNALEKLSEKELISQIKSLKSETDVVIATFHWGTEYSAQSSALQKRLARLSIDSGADAVIGHHPHWVQEKEIYQGKPIYYSLGNLIFDQPWSEKTRQGLVVKLFFSGKNFLTAQELHIRIDNLGQPRFND